MAPHTTMALVVAIDGPSGSGKSSVSRAVAAARGLAYLDTGAMFRAVTSAVLDRGIDPADSAAVTQVSAHLVLESGTEPDSPWVHVDGIDVGEKIRGHAVTSAVSAVSAVPEVRHLLAAIQRSIVESAVGAGRGIVVEGRDIGTVVLPEADVKIFLVADAGVRAHRRARQDAAREGSQPVSSVDVRSDLDRRDQADSSRDVSPLRPALDAVVVDATSLTLGQVVARVLELTDAAAVLELQ
jgi:cytidylate kinase